MPLEKVDQDQIHELLFKETLSWQAIIYDLINTEQLNPWDIDLTLLSQKYLEKVRSLEDANFFVSSKVLYAAALLLRIKAEVVLNHDLRTLDEILMGKKEEHTYTQERIELEGTIPELVPRTPLPRFKRVTLDELMSALGKAIATETRRIRKVVLVKQQEKETAISLPKQHINLKEHIEHIYSRLQRAFSSRTERLGFSELLAQEHGSREDRVAAFVALLHLDNQQRVWLEQPEHFEEIWILLKELYMQQNHERLEAIRTEVAAFFEQAAKEADAEEHASVAEAISADEDGEEKATGLNRLNSSVKLERTDEDEA